MLKGILLALSLVAAAPNLDGVDVKASALATCGDGSVMVVEQYVDEGLLFSRETGPVVYFNKGAQKFYVYSQKKYYTQDELIANYPSPCDVPSGMGT